MTTPTDLSASRLALLVHLTQVFNSSLNLDEVLELVIDETIKAIKAERGFVMLRDAGGQLAFRTARGIDHQTIADPEFEVSRSIVEEVAQKGEPMLTSDALLDPRWNTRQSVQGLRLRSIMCAPLKVKEKTIGAVYLDNRLQAGIFTQGDLDLLAALASSAAIAIENARLYQIALEKARMERELQMARKVQASLLPPELPALPGWDFAADWLPAREVAGDYYDVITPASGRLGLIVGDVTDKGLPASLFMVFSRSTMRAIIGRYSSPVEEIAHVNQSICQESAQGLYITLIYAQLDPVSGSVIYVNAGHNPGLLYRAETGALTWLKPTGMPLGIDEDAVYGQASLTLLPGDALLLYTDGIPEAINTAEEEFGMERLEQVLLENIAQPAPAIVRCIEEAVNAFTGAVQPFDDITLMLLKRL